MEKNTTAIQLQYTTISPRAIRLLRTDCPFGARDCTTGQLPGLSCVERQLRSCFADFFHSNWYRNLNVRLGVAHAVSRLQQLAGRTTEEPRLNPPLRRMWFDSICINQDRVEERPSQVRLMGEVYSRSVKTLFGSGHKYRYRRGTLRGGFCTRFIPFLKLRIPTPPTGPKLLGRFTHIRFMQTLAFQQLYNFLECFNL